jgi:hypothetical protein
MTEYGVVRRIPKIGPRMALEADRFDTITNHEARSVGLRIFYRTA